MKQRTEAQACAVSVLPAVVSVFLTLCASTTAQIGTSVCVCSPSTYEMTFNFLQTCENSVVNGSGVFKTDCVIAPAFQYENVTDLIPVSLGTVQIQELDANLVILKQTVLFETYHDGETFSYTSISSDPAMIDATIYPKALEIAVVGNNAAGESLSFTGLIIYVTDCTVLFPVILEGSSCGWVTFVSINERLTLPHSIVSLPNTIFHFLL
jgi:hypothetical protein